MKKSMFQLIIDVIAYSIIFTSLSFAAEDITILNKNTDNPTIYYKGNSWLGTGPIDEHRIFNWKWGSTWFDHKSWFDYMENNKFNFGRAYAMSGWPYYDHKKDPANRIFPFKVDHWNDDDPVVDLLQMDATYWSNFSRVLQKAEDRGIIICIQLYQKHQFNGNFRTELFFHRDNNINGVNITDNTIWKAMSNAYPNGILWTIHSNWVNQILDAIGTNENVIIDLMNEPDIKTISKEWVDRTLDLIEAWESANSRDILVGMDIDHVLARDSQADIAWVLGHPRMELIVGEDHWIYDQTSLLINHRKENKKPMVWVNEKKNGYMDTRILSDSPNRRRHYLWLGMMTKIQGLGLYDKKNHTQEDYLGSLQATELGNYNKILFNFFENTIADYSGLNVATNVIDSAPSSDSKVCLSSSDEVVVYLHKGFGLSQGSGATLKLKNLSLPNGDVNITFFHPENGNTSSLTKNISGTNLDITLPEYAENIAVYIKPTGISEDPPTITAELQDQTVTVGQTATFKVTATGTTPLSYQWQKNNVDIADAPNSSTYITPSATLADNGNQYRCIVTNDYGTATSNNATLTVTEPSGNDYFVESGGQVVIEAENYDQSNANGDSGGEWNNNTSPPSGAVGDSMQAPNAAAASWSNGAELVYNIKFNNTGNYTVWLRRWADKGGKNSCFKGYDDSQVGGTIDNRSPSTNWVWIDGGAISVSSTGVHTLNIRRREKLYQIDRIVLKTATGAPSGSGPAESPRDGGIVTTYALSVVNGSGDGDYEEGAVVYIEPDNPPAGQEFDIWTGDVAYVADVNAYSTTVTMPASTIVVTATFRDTQVTQYFLTVNNGSGDGSYTEGTVVNIEADAPHAGQVFNNWSGDVADVADKNNSNTTITMPERDVTVTATYDDILGETKYSIESAIAGKNNPDPVAFDNDIVTRWQSNNNDNSNWAEFNLGSSKQVTKIRIYHDYGSNLTGIDLKVDEISKWSGTLNKQQWEEIVLSGVRGQKIKLDRNSNYRLRINEIEIYGTSSAQ